MSSVAWLLCALFSGSLGGPVGPARRSADLTQVQTEKLVATRPPYLQLPMFLHARGPLVARELFSPVPHRRPLPAEVPALLLPVTAPQQQRVQTSSARAVEVWCGDVSVSVRVDRFQLSSWTDPARFSLGSCGVSSVSARYLYFNSRLTACGARSKVSGDQLVYSFILGYSPPPQQGFIIRAIPLLLPIHCYYNRFHYSFQVGFRPEVPLMSLVKSVRSKLSFSLTVTNDQWEPLPSGYAVPLGESVYFVAQAGVLLLGERLYVDSCYASSSREPTAGTAGTTEPSTGTRVDLITNYGCMMDSRREGSSSCFRSAGAAVLRFALDAFVFTPASQVLFLHCSMSVSLSTSPSSKACNYNAAAGRWEELEALPSVCSCCDSVCDGGSGAEGNTVSSQSWFIKPEDKPQTRTRTQTKSGTGTRSFQAEEAREWEDEEEGKKRSSRREEDVKRVQNLLPDHGHKDRVVPEAAATPPAETEVLKRSSEVRQQGEAKEEEEEDTTEEEEDTMEEEEEEEEDTKEEEEEDTKEEEEDTKEEEEDTEEEEEDTEEEEDMKVEEEDMNEEEEDTKEEEADTKEKADTNEADSQTESVFTSEGNRADGTSSVLGTRNFSTDLLKGDSGRNFTSWSGNARDPGPAGNVFTRAAGERTGPDGSGPGAGTTSELRAALGTSELDSSSSGRVVPGSEQMESGSKPVDGEPEQRPDGALRSLQIRGSELDLDPARLSRPGAGLFWEAGSDSGWDEGEALTRFTEGAGTRTEDSASGLKQRTQDSPGHAFTVVVTEALLDSESGLVPAWEGAESGLVSAGEWSEPGLVPAGKGVEPEWDLHSSYE